MNAQYEQPLLTECQFFLISNYVPERLKQNSVICCQIRWPVLGIQEEHGLPHASFRCLSALPRHGLQTPGDRMLSTWQSKHEAQHLHCLLGRSLESHQQPF